MCEACEYRFEESLSMSNMEKPTKEPCPKCSKKKVKKTIGGFPALSADSNLTANNATAAANNRTRRDSLMAESDWMVIKSQETSTTLNADWATYRQALRDITAHAKWPNLASPAPDGSGGDWPAAPE